MNKAFTKDDAWEEPLVPARAPLPDGVPNYVTRRGLSLLREEMAELEAHRQQLDSQSDEVERRRRHAIVSKRISDLAARIASAEVVDPNLQDRDTVRFGAAVTLRTESGERTGEQRRLEIVGVDEADPANGRVAFTAPIARAVLGREVGEAASLRTARGEELLLIESIEYPAE